MSDCYCDYDSMPDFFSEKFVYAKKKHICCECGKEIKIGDEYKYITGKWDGDFITYKTCEKCSNLFESLKDVGCPYYMGLYEEYWDYLVSTIKSMDDVRKQYDKVKNGGYHE